MPLNSISPQKPEFEYYSGMAVMGVTVASASPRTMTMTVTELHLDPIDAALDRVERADNCWSGRNARAPGLNVEAVASSASLAAGPKWAIRFGAGGFVTIVLGMRNFGRGCYSAYFASLLASRLGVPFRKIRLYYSLTHPAVLHTPLPASIIQDRSNISPVAQAAADVIEKMCDQVIAEARSNFAATARVSAVDIGYDQPSGRFCVVGTDWSRNVLEIAESAGDEASVAKALRINSGAARACCAPAYKCDTCEP